MIVYVDVAFAINLFIDSGLLLVTGSLLRQRLRLVRVLLAATVGSLYAVAVLFPGTNWMRAVELKWLCSVVMVDIAFGTRWLAVRTFPKLLYLLKLVAAFYAVTFALAGAVYAVHSLLASGRSSLAGLALVGGRIAWWTSMTSVFLALAMPFGLLLIRYLMGQLGHMRRRTTYICSLSVAVSDRSATLRALVDTGNTLTDPITQKAVAVANLAVVAPLLPRALAEALSGHDDPLGALEAVDGALGEFSSRLRVVPYRSIGGRGLLLAFRPDSVVAIYGEQEINLPSLLIALQPQGMARLEDFDCILPGSVAASILEGREISVDTCSRASSGEASHTSHSA